MSADLRAEFEAWARGCSTISLQRDPDAKEDYLRSVTQAAYLAYQAAAHATARKCIAIAREVDEQDERNNGAASTGAAATVWTRLTDEFQEAFGGGVEHEQAKYLAATRAGGISNPLPEIYGGGFE